MDEIILTEKCCLTRHPWALAVRGVVAIIFGLLALIWPGFVAGALVLVFAAYFLVQGLFALFTAADLRREAHRGTLVIQALFGIGAGLALFFFPRGFMVIIVWVIAFWALVSGSLEIGAALHLPPGAGGKWLFLLSGIFSILIGLALLARPGAGVVAVLWMFGIYAILAGVARLAVAFRIRSLLK